MRFLVILLALAGSLAAQTRSGPFTPVTASRITRGAGAPPSGLCAAASDVGKVYVRQDTAAANASLYVCANTAVMTYAWEHPDAGGGGGGGGATIPSVTTLIKGDGAGNGADSGITPAQVVLAVSPGAGIAHFPGASQTATSSLIVNADIAAGTIDLTAKVTGALPVANGGTGLATITSNALTKGNGTGAEVVTGVAVDGSNNISTAGTISSGVGGSVGGAIDLGQGTLPGLGANTVSFVAPTSVTSYEIVMPGAAATGIFHLANASNVVTGTFGAVNLASADVTGLLPAANLVNSGVFTGDVTTTFPAVTVAKVNGIAYSATAAAHSVEVITSANTTATAKVIPDCTDTGGNHINYTQSSDAFSCGTSGGGGGGIAFPQTVSGTTTSGGIPYFSNTTTLTSSALLDLNQVVSGGGAGAAPASFANLTNDGTTITNTVNALGTTQTTSLLLTNTTAAANNAQQISPGLRLTGRVWQTTAGASQQADVFLDNLPTQGTSASAGGNLRISSALNGGALAQVAVIGHTLDQAADFWLGPTAPTSGNWILEGGAIAYANGTTSFGIYANGTLDLYLTQTDFRMDGSNVTGFANGNASNPLDTTFCRKAAGVIQFGTSTTCNANGSLVLSTVQTGTFTVSGLPTCNAGAEGTRAGATDLLTPTFLTAAVGGGAVHGSVYCDGTSWKTD